MNKVLLLMIAILPHSTQAQVVKKNETGKKMIKSIVIDHLNGEGEVDSNSWHTTYNMEYFPDCTLKSIQRSWKYGKNRYTQKYWFDEEYFHYEATANGKKLDNVNFVAGTPYYKKIGDRKGRANLLSSTITVKEIEPGGFPVYNRTVRFYKVNGINNFIELGMVADDTVEKEVKRIAEEPHRIAHFSSSRGATSVCPHADFTNAGFKGVSMVAEGDDGLLYRLWLKKEKRKEWIGGNFYSSLDDPESTIRLGDRFLNRRNDTNINLAGILEYDYFEMITEWVNMWSSVNLIEIEEQRGDGKWTRKWEYYYDENDNIYEIAIIDKKVALPNYIVKIDYVMENE